MPLTDLIRPRICELGKIKIGGKGETRQGRNGPYRLPVKFDHFVITTLNRTEHGDLVPDADLMEALKGYRDPDGKLRQVPVAVLSNDIEDIVTSSYVWYAGKKICGRSDGKTCTIYFDRKTSKWLDEPLVYKWNPTWAERDAQGNRLFKLHTSFACVIAAPQARWGGVYKLRTTSVITAEQLVGSLVQVKMLTGGMLRGVPLRLVIRPVEVAPPPEFKAKTVYVVHLELVGPDLVAIQQAALDRAKLELANAQAVEQTRQQYRKLLGIPGQGESTDEQADVAEEFHTVIDEDEDLLSEDRVGDYGDGGDFDDREGPSDEAETHRSREETAEERKAREFLESQKSRNRPPAGART